MQDEVEGGRHGGVFLERVQDVREVPAGGGGEAEG